MFTAVFAPPSSCPPQASLFSRLTWYKLSCQSPSLTLLCFSLHPLQNKTSSYSLPRDDIDFVSFDYCYFQGIEVINTYLLFFKKLMLFIIHIMFILYVYLWVYCERVCMCVHVWVYVWTCICMSVSDCMCVSLCVSVCMCGCVCICVSLWMCVWVCTSMCECQRKLWKVDSLRHCESLTQVVGLVAGILSAEPSPCQPSLLNEWVYEVISNIVKSKITLGLISILGRNL